MWAESFFLAPAHEVQGRGRKKKRKGEKTPPARKKNMVKHQIALKFLSPPFLKADDEESRTFKKRAEGKKRKGQGGGTPPGVVNGLSAPPP